MSAYRRFTGGAASYQGGAETGAELTAGATLIDENLLQMRDGAAGCSGAGTTTAR